jgi:hypothetical protein
MKPGEDQMEHKAESETNSNGITEASLYMLQWGFFMHLIFQGLYLLPTNWGRSLYSRF